MPVFVDTNVLLYARDAAEPRLNLTRKLDPGLTPEQAQLEIGLLLTWKPIPPSAELLRAAWRLEAAHSVSFWDAMILAAARSAGCDRVLSEDMTDGQIYDGVEVLSPFTHEPG